MAENCENMDILAFLAQEEIRAGAHKRCIHLTRELARRGHRVTLVSPLRDAPSEVHQVRVGPFWEDVVPFHKLSYALSATFHLRRVWKALRQSDCILLFGLSNVAFALPALLLSRLPLVFAMRGQPLRFQRLQAGGSIWARNCLYRGMLRATFWRARRIVFQSESDQERYVTSYSIPSEKTAVVPNNITVSSSERQRHRSLLERILFVGGLSKRKGVDVMLEGFLNVAGEHDVTLSIAGDGPLKPKLQRRLASSMPRVSERVELLGYVDGVEALMGRHDLLVVPSRADPFPNVVLEALGLGVPVIGSDVGGISTMLEHRQLLLKPGDPHALAERLSALCRHAHLYEEVKRLCASRRPLFEFDWARRFEDVLAEVV
jgi:glycosyltransferase involved in cell wall biosynthesis